MSAPYPFPYKSVACTFLLLWVFVFLSADLFAGSFRTLGIKEGLASMPDKQGFSRICLGVYSCRDRSL